MKKLLFATACSIPVGVIAQPVFTAADFTPVLGPTPMVHSTDYIPAGPASAGFTFDASSAQLGPGNQSQWVTVASTPYASSFPQATMASTGLTNQDTYSYFQIANNEFLNWGLYGTQMSVIYTNPEKLYQFPLTYGSSWTDNFSGTATASGFSMTRTGTTAVAYNGHGTVIMPFGTFNNVARLQINQTYTDDIMGFVTTTQVNTVSYIKGGQPTALFTSSEVLVDIGAGLEPQAEMSSIIEPAAVGVLELEIATIGALLMPNPASEFVTILFTEQPSATLEARIFDSTGRTVRSFTNESMKGDQLTFDVGDLIPGAYYVQLHERSGANCTMPLIIN